MSLTGAGLGHEGMAVAGAAPGPRGTVARDRFLREIRTVAQLHHPHVPLSS